MSEFLKRSEGIEIHLSDLRAVMIGNAWHVVTREHGEALAFIGPCQLFRGEKGEALYVVADMTEPWIQFSSVNGDEWVHAPLSAVQAISTE